LRRPLGSRLTRGCGSVRNDGAMTLPKNYNIKFRQIKALKAVVETGSFKAAADCLFVTQPSLSTMIKELEDDLGLTLLIRSTRSNELTPEGREFYEEIRGSIDQIERAYDYAKSVAKGEAGRLRIALLPSLGVGVVAPVVADFHRQYPKLRIELHERNYVDFLLSIRRKEVDLGIGGIASAIPPPEFQFVPLFKERLVVVVPTGHPLASQALKLEQLGKYEFVMVTPGPSIPVLDSLRVDINASIQVNHPSTALGLVRNGAGIAILPARSLNGLITDDLVAIRIPGSAAYREIGMLWLKRTTLNASTNAFAESVKASFQSLKDSDKI